jgi:hypothetical protein
MSSRADAVNALGEAILKHFYDHMDERIRAGKPVPKHPRDNTPVYPLLYEEVVNCLQIRQDFVVRNSYAQYYD